MSSVSNMVLVLMFVAFNIIGVYSEANPHYRYPYYPAPAPAPVPAPVPAPAPTPAAFDYGFLDPNALGLGIGGLGLAGLGNFGFLGLGGLGLGTATVAPGTTYTTVCACRFSGTPICGSDSVQYRNLCLLICARRQNTNLLPVSVGPCNGLFVSG